MPDVIEPGTRLVSRYRLEKHLGVPGDGGADGTEVTTTGGGQVKGATYWRAHDELLDRAVGVCLLKAGSSYAERVLAAAREAAVLTDARFLRILDAAEVDGIVYVVTEWVPARTLADLVSDEPLPPAEARLLAAEVAGALAVAHESGISHLSLRPENVLRTSHGQVKLAGLAVDAAARGIAVPAGPEEAERRDLEGAAALLYAALTGRWPSDAATNGDGSSAHRTTLPPAPLDGPSVCSPRQVRAGVPDDLDDIVGRALGIPGRHHGPALTTLAELRDELASAQVTSRLSVPSQLNAAADHGAQGTYAPEGAAGYPQAEPSDTTPPRLGPLPVAALVLGLLLAGVLATMLVIGALDRPGGPVEGTPGESPTSTGQGRAGQPIQVESARSFDPEPEGTGDENDDRVPLAVDDDPSTAWVTKTYNDPFGPSGLKDGVGLLLDLGTSQDITQVRVDVTGTTDLQLRVADREGDSAEDFQVVDDVKGADGPATLRPEEPTRARYVLVWLTSLPLVDGGYRGEVAEVSLRG